MIKDTPGRGDLSNEEKAEDALRQRIWSVMSATLIIDYNEERRTTQIGGLAVCVEKLSELIKQEKLNHALLMGLSPTLRSDD